jgi:hypothetical protein
MDNYQNFMEKFFEDFDISLDIFGEEDDKRAIAVKTLISNKTLIISNIRKNVNAIVTLSENGTSKTYAGFLVDIVHKDNGKINSQRFGFKDYMPMNCRIGNETKKTWYSIIDHCGKDWYGSAPNDEEIRRMVKAIMRYIGMWA